MILGRPMLYWTPIGRIDILNHAISPTIRIKTTLMGTDKWGHFFQQGFWLWDATAKGALTLVSVGISLQLIFSLWERRHGHRIGTARNV